MRDGENEEHRDVAAEPVSAPSLVDGEDHPVDPKSVFVNRVMTLWWVWGGLLAEGASIHLDGLRHDVALRLRDHLLPSGDHLAA